MFAKQKKEKKLERSVLYYSRNTSVAVHPNGRGRRLWTWAPAWLLRALWKRGAGPGGIHEFIVNTAVVDREEASHVVEGAGRLGWSECG
jgi:hypothetical protein